MIDTELIWPSDDMDFWEIKNDGYKLRIKWKHKYFDDYKKLSNDFYECGLSIFEDVISSTYDNTKSDICFLTGIFLFRQSIELGLKSLLCRVYCKNKDIQNAFLECCHDLSKLFEKYNDTEAEEYLTKDEYKWLRRYLISLELVDARSDVFRFPFEDSFLARYENKFLDNVDIANNLLQAYALVKKCLDKGCISEDYKFESNLKPEFFVFATHGIGNCHLWQILSDNGFYVKITGYSKAIDYIYKNDDISLDTKFYPLMFMFRNTLELCLKRLFYSRVDDSVPEKVFYSKRKSHLIRKDLWKNVRLVIEKYAKLRGYDLALIDIVESQLYVINLLDKNGDKFRYPTSYSLEYRFDDIIVDLENIYIFFKGILNFLDGSDHMLDDISNYQAEMKAEYEAEMQSEMQAYMDWQ